MSLYELRQTQANPSSSLFRAGQKEVNNACLHFRRFYGETHEIRGWFCAYRVDVVDLDRG